MNMSWRSVPRLVALMGPSRAKQLIVLRQKVSAEKAESWGLVDEVTAPGKTYDAALKLGEAYAALPPLALRMAKQAIETSAHALSYATSFMDRDQFLLTAHSKDRADALNAFVNKGKPHTSDD